jgi:outer membrane protein TolC
MEQHRASRDLGLDNYRVALMNYKAGVGTMTELLEAETLLNQAENAYTDSRISYRIAARKFADYNK